MSRSGGVQLYECHTDEAPSSRPHHREHTQAFRGRHTHAHVTGIHTHAHPGAQGTYIHSCFFSYCDRHAHTGPPRTHRQTRLTHSGCWVASGRCLSLALVVLMVFSPTCTSVLPPPSPASPTQTSSVCFRIPPRCRCHSAAAVAVVVAGAAAGDDSESY